MTHLLENNKKLLKKLSVASGIYELSSLKTISMLTKRAVSGLPNKELPIRLSNSRMERCERIDDNLIFIELDNGRKFYGTRSEGKEYVLYHMFKPIIPKQVSCDAYKLALDIERRYFKSKKTQWYMKPGGTFIEGGCFTGLKAIGWYDAYEGNCRIIAVEIGALNSELLRKNIEVNGLERSIKPIHAGLWNESKEGIQRHNFSTRRFLEKTDQWEKQMSYTEPCQMLTVDDMLDQAEVEIADYMNVQVNGAEIEVLKGFKHFDRVKVMGIASYYSKNGQNNVDVVRQMLLDEKCKIIHESKTGRITCITPRYIDEIMALKSSS